MTRHKKNKATVRPLPILITIDGRLTGASAQEGEKTDQIKHECIQFSMKMLENSYTLPDLKFYSFLTIL